MSPSILVVGDSHGNDRFLTSAIQRASARGIDTLLQLGDFGIWQGKGGKRFIRIVSSAALSHGVTTYAIGGNHEDYDWIRLFEQHPDPDGFVTLLPGVRWIPRGHRWEWGCQRFGALGGAFSVDHAFREAGKDWWPGAEELQAEDVERLGPEPLDVLVSHEVPLDAEPMSPAERQLEVAPADEVQAARTRELLRLVVERTQPRLVLHGHWHERNTKTLSFAEPNDPARPTVRVEGLASDQENDGRSWGVLDLETLEFRDGDELQPRTYRP